jgi:hypothetical protein
VPWPIAWPLAGCPWLLPTPQRFRAAANWLELVRQGVLDGALLSGLELEEAEGVNRQELALLPLVLGAVPEVLVPDRGVAPGLRRLLRELGLTLRSGGNSLQTPDDWIGRIRGSSLASRPHSAAPHRPGAGADGQVVTAGGLKVCAPCIDPKLAPPTASGLLPHGFR